MRLHATTDAADAVARTDVTFVIVPTPSGADGAFSNAHVIAAVRKIGAALRAKRSYHLVVITSTVMPGATGGPIREALEVAAGRTVGETIGLCYSPEFIALGSVIHDMLNPDFFLIGELDSRSGDMLERIYRAMCENGAPVQRISFVNAELAKIAINTYVTTKISFANMLSDICDHLPGADAVAVTAALGHDSRIGDKYLMPALGYGGPCFPRDTVALASMTRRLGVHADIVEGDRPYQPTAACADGRIGAWIAHAGDDRNIGSILQAEHPGYRAKSGYCDGNAARRGRISGTGARSPGNACCDGSPARQGRGNGSSRRLCCGGGSVDYRYAMAKFSAPATRRATARWWSATRY